MATLFNMIQDQGLIFPVGVFIGYLFGACLFFLGLLVLSRFLLTTYMYFKRKCIGYELIESDPGPYENAFSDLNSHYGSTASLPKERSDRIYVF